MRGGVESVGEVKWEMLEEGGDGGEGGRVTACYENNWSADGKMNHR